MTVSPLSIFIREKNSAKYINYNRSAWNHRIAAYEDLSGYEQADVDCSGDQCTEDKSECISGCTEGSECGKSGAGAARAIWCYCAGKTNYLGARRQLPCAGDRSAVGKARIN